MFCWITILGGVLIMMGQHDRPPFEGGFLCVATVLFLRAKPVFETE